MTISILNEVKSLVYNKWTLGHLIAGPQALGLQKGLGYLERHENGDVVTQASVKGMRKAWIG